MYLRAFYVQIILGAIIAGSVQLSVVRTVSSLLLVLT